MVSHQNVSSVEEDFSSILLRVQRCLLVKGPHLAPIELDDELVLGDVAVLGAFAAFLVVGRRLVLVDE